MHNVNVEAIEATAAKAAADPAAGVNPVALTGQWNVEEGATQFTTEIPLPGGGTVGFAADFPPAMGGTGAAPSPLAYCFWGGLACYAMTFAQEAAREGVELRALRGWRRAVVGDELLALLRGQRSLRIDDQLRVVVGE